MALLSKLIGQLANWHDGKNKSTSAAYMVKNIIIKDGSLLFAWLMNIILRNSIQCILFYLWWKYLRYTPLTRIWKVTMLQLVKGSGEKAGRCQSCTNFFSEALTNVCGARELRKIWNVLKPFSLGKWVMIKIHYERCLRGLKKFQVSLSLLAAHT